MALGWALTVHCLAPLLFSLFLLLVGGSVDFHPTVGSISLQPEAQTSPSLPELNLLSVMLFITATERKTASPLSPPQ